MAKALFFTFVIAVFGMAATSAAQTMSDNIAHHHAQLIAAAE